MCFKPDQPKEVEFDPKSFDYPNMEYKISVFIERRLKIRVIKLKNIITRQLISRSKNR